MRGGELVKDALKMVLRSLTDAERAVLWSVVDKMMGANELERFPCPGDCDSHLARINLCSHCRLLDQVLEPIEDALREIRNETQ